MHVHHPKVIPISSDGVNSLFETDFDFEAQSIEFNRLEWIQVKVSYEQKNSSSLWVLNENKLDESAKRSRQRSCIER